MATETTKMMMITETVIFPDDIAKVAKQASATPGQTVKLPDSYADHLRGMNLATNAGAADVKAAGSKAAADAEAARINAEADAKAEADLLAAK